MCQSTYKRSIDYWTIYVKANIIAACTTHDSTRWKRCSRLWRTVRACGSSASWSTARSASATSTTAWVSRNRWRRGTSPICGEPGSSQRERTACGSTIDWPSLQTLSLTPSCPRWLTPSGTRRWRPAISSVCHSGSRLLVPGSCLSRPAARRRDLPDGRSLTHN